MRPIYSPQSGDADCLGFSEHKTELAIDDFRSRRVPEACSQLGWPARVHSDHWAPLQLNWDEPPLSRLQQLADELPDVTFILHRPGCWSKLSSHAPPGVTCLAGAIEPGGLTDCSLGPPMHTPTFWRSPPYNAPIRDPDFTPESVGATGTSTSSTQTTSSPDSSALSWSG